MCSTPDRCRSDRLARDSSIHCRVMIFPSFGVRSAALWPHPAWISVRLPSSEKCDLTDFALQKPRFGTPNCDLTVFSPICFENELLGAHSANFRDLSRIRNSRSCWASDSDPNVPSSRPLSASCPLRSETVIQDFLVISQATASRLVLEVTEGHKFPKFAEFLRVITMTSCSKMSSP